MLRASTGSTGRAAGFFCDSLPVAVSCVSLPWLSPVALSHSSLLWVSPMALPSGSPPWLSPVVLSCGKEEFSYGKLPGLQEEVHIEYRINLHIANMKKKESLFEETKGLKSSEGLLTDLILEFRFLFFSPSPPTSSNNCEGIREIGESCCVWKLL